MRDIMFSQQRSWRLRSTGMWRLIDWKSHRRFEWT